MDYKPEVTGKLLLALRKEAGLSQAELSSKFGCTEKQISQYEHGKLLPPIYRLTQYCELFDCELGYLLGEESYSDGTRLETLFRERLGLSKEAIQLLEELSGTKKTQKQLPLFVKYEAAEYQRMLSSLIISDAFLPLLEQLVRLDNTLSEHRKNWDAIRDEYGETGLSDAIKLYLETDGIQPDEPSQDITPLQLAARNRVDKAIEEDARLDYTAKVLRYEARESYEALLLSIFPDLDRFGKS